MTNENINFTSRESQQLENKSRFSEQDFKLIEERFGVKITQDDIRRDPQVFFKRVLERISGKSNQEIKYSDAEIEALIHVARHNKTENQIFYEGQGQDLVKAKKEWVDDMVTSKDFLGKIAKLSNYLKKISLLKTNNGYHEYASLLIEALNGRDVNVDHVCGMPSEFNGSKCVNLNPDLFTAKPDSKNFLERVFYHFAKILGNELAFVGTVLHEATHVLMMDKINNPKTPEEIEARDALYSIYSYVVSVAPKYDAEKFYGLTNLDEFCAEYYVAGKIRDLVKKIEANHSQDDFPSRNDYPETMVQPPMKLAFEKTKRILIKRSPNNLRFSAKNLSQRIEDNVRKLIGASLEYELKDESIDGMIINIAARALAKTKKLDEAATIAK